jgi:hypothetical protein
VAFLEISDREHWNAADREGCGMERRKGGSSSGNVRRTKDQR